MQITALCAAADAERYATGQPLGLSEDLVQPIEYPGKFFRHQLIAFRIGMKTIGR